MSQIPAEPNMAAIAARIAALAAQANAKLDAGAYITCAELGAILGLDKAVVSRLAAAKRYPSQQPTGPGGARRFSPADVDAIKAATAAPVSA